MEDLSPLLKSRNKALEVYYLQKEKPKFIVSGGKWGNESAPEVYDIKKYLISEEISAKKIIMEDKSIIIFENMFFSKSNILEDWVQREKRTEQVIIFLEVHYLQKKPGMKADGIEVPTAFIFYQVR